MNKIRDCWVKYLDTVVKFQGIKVHHLLICQESDDLCARGTLKPSHSVPGSKRNRNPASELNHGPLHIGSMAYVSFYPSFQHSSLRIY